MRYAEVYPGIDVVYYGNQRRLEYDFVVAPGRDARTIALEFAGAETVEVDGGTGDLLLRVGEETVRQHAPVTYQETAGGGRREVESRYALRDGGQVGFEVGEYDRSRALVIDPTLVYSTFFGGSAIEQSPRIAVDSAGNAYVTGTTFSTDFPTTVGAFDTTIGGGRDVFVLKLNSTGSGLIYSTYLGGNSIDQALGIAVDPAGNAYVTGQTQSLDFPTTPGAFDTTSFAANDLSCFVTKLNANGSNILYSTWLKGPHHSSAGLSRGTDIAVDSSGNAYVVGVSASSDFPTTAGAFARTNAGSLDLFVTKLNPNGSSLVYSTLFGGANNDNSSRMALDAAGNAIVTGFTESDIPTTPGAFDTTYSGGAFDGFVTKFNADGSGLLYSTFLGGSGVDSGSDIAVDAEGNAYVTGITRSTDFPTTCGASFDTTLSGLEDAFVSKLNPTGTALVYSTYLGGSGVSNSGTSDAGGGIAVDSDGNAYVTGITTSSDFPVTSGALDTTFNGGSDAFVTKLNSPGTALILSTFLGGASDESGTGIALDAAGDIYVAGDTLSSDFPTTTGAFDGAINNTSRDGFISKINDTTAAPAPGPIPSCPTPTPTPTPTPSPTPSQATVQFSSATFSVTEGCVPATLTVTLSGSPAGAVAVDYTVSEGTARQKTDFTYVAGTLLPQSSAPAHSGPAFAAQSGGAFFSGQLIFAKGETAKEITILITEDGFAEGTENLSATLSNPRGAGLGSPATTTLNIQDNETVDSQTNPLDDASTFVCQNYHDFLHRQPDPAGQAFWAEGITRCGADQSCVGTKRHDVAAAFFLSIEFQQTGYFVYRAYEAGLNRRPQYEEFMRDLNAVGQGVEVGTGDWQQRLSDQRRAFAEQMVESVEFKTLLPDGMEAGAFADRLFQHAGAAPTAAERGAVVTAYGVGNAQGRAAALVAALETGSVYNRLYNPGFVLVEYFGFLRRDPDDAPDSDMSGYDFWLQKMDSFTLAGEDARLEATAFERIKRSEMIRAFIVADEYRKRFGQ
ncbi:MAG: SBBP repeat-containing protein [Pyrinomonadaceae bacterium]